MAIKGSGVGSRTATSCARHNLMRRLLVVGEVALALVLLIGAGLALRSFSHLLNVNLGFRPTHLLTMQIDTPSFQFAKLEQQSVFVREVLDRVRPIPGITAAAVVSFAPFSGLRAETAFRLEGASSDSHLDKHQAELNEVTPGYFGTLGVPLISGRDFSDADVAGTPLVYIVNLAFARRYFGVNSPLGRRLNTSVWKNQAPAGGEIIGVVGDSRNSSGRAAPKPELYGCLYQSTNNWNQQTLLARTQADPFALAPALENQIRAINRNLPITQVRTMDEGIAQANAEPRFQTLLLSIFGALALLLAVVGMYGVISNSVSQRTQEIGIRVALGAEPRQVLGLVLKEGLTLTATGVGIGVLASLVLTRLMSNQLFGVSATDPATFFGVAILLAGVALAACYIPARRATKVDPMVALRCE